MASSAPLRIGPCQTTPQGFVYPHLMEAFAAERDAQVWRCSCAVLVGNLGDTTQLMGGLGSRSALPHPHPLFASTPPSSCKGCSLAGSDFSTLVSTFLNGVSLLEVSNRALCPRTRCGGDAPSRVAFLHRTENSRRVPVKCCLASPVHLPSSAVLQPQGGSCRFFLSLLRSVVVPLKL